LVAYRSRPALTTCYASFHTHPFRSTCTIAALAETLCACRGPATPIRLGFYRSSRVRSGGGARPRWHPEEMPRHVHRGRPKGLAKYTLSTLSVHLSCTLGLPFVYRWYTPSRDGSREVESRFFQQSCGFCGPHGINDSARDSVFFLKTPDFSTLLVHPRATPGPATRLMGPLRRGYREDGYKSAALPTELRRPNVRQCPIPRKRPPTSLWAEISVCV